MKKVVFSNHNITYYTYSSSQYDRTNNDLPTLLLKFNAKDFRGKYLLELNIIYNDLLLFKKTEMKEALHNTSKNLKIN